MFQDMLAIDEHMNHASCELLWFVKGRMVLNGLGIKHNHIREVALSQEAAALDS